MDDLISRKDLIQEIEPMLTWELLEKITEMPAVDRWISVKDRLPENSGTVICFSAAGVFAGWYGERAEQWYFERGNGNVCSLPVTHWMPLPEPPEVER